MRALNIARGGILPEIAAASVISSTALAGSSAERTSIPGLFQSAATDGVGETADYRRQVVDYSTREPVGRVIVDTFKIVVLPNVATPAVSIALRSVAPRAAL